MDYSTIWDVLIKNMDNNISWETKDRLSFILGSTSVCQKKKWEISRSLVPVNCICWMHLVWDNVSANQRPVQLILTNEKLWQALQWRKSNRFHHIPPWWLHLCPDLTGDSSQWVAISSVWSPMRDQSWMHVWTFIGISPDWDIGDAGPVLGCDIPQANSFVLRYVT